MYIALVIVVSLIVVLAAVIIIMTLSRRIKVTSKNSVSEPQKVDLPMIWMMGVSLVLLLTLACGVWQMRQLNTTLKSIDTRLSSTNDSILNANKKLDVINTTLGTTNTDLGNIYLGIFNLR